VKKRSLPVAAPDDLLGEPRVVVLLAAPTVSSLEIAGPAEAFFMAAYKLREAGRINGRHYRVHLLSATDADIVGEGGVLRVRTECSFRDFEGPIDTLLAIGGNGVWTGNDVPGLGDWLRLHCQQARRFGSICTGAFMLAGITASGSRTISRR
jgi:transcriptional regulator GlxA family with amidase domain